MRLEEWQKVEKFIPMTYLESIQGKPLVIKLTDKWNFVTCPQDACNFINVIDRKDFVTHLFDHYKSLPSENPNERMGKHIGLLTAIKALTDILYEISKDEYYVGLFKRKDKPTRKQKQYYKFLSTHLLHNTDIMFDLWERVLEVNARLEKKNDVPTELQGSTRPRSMDKWRGFLHKRSDFRTKAFLTYLHEDEEETIQVIRQHNTHSEKQKTAERMSRMNRQFAGN
jgi:hypothetical protein